jgi:hypothetical protein
MRSLISGGVAAALAMSCLCATAWAAPDAKTQAEVAHLLDRVATPGCQFNRNGTWYDGIQARQHLQDKYDYLVKRDMVPDAEAFITRAASSSSMSGKAYLVKCGNAAAEPSGPWLTRQLQRFRAGAARPGTRAP